MDDVSIRDSTLVEYDYEHTFETSYVRFPLLAKVQIPTKYVTPYLKVGPDLGILTSAERETKGYYSTPQISGQDQLNPITETEDLKSQLRRIGLALHVGGGVDVPIGAAATFLEVAYSCGLSNINESTGLNFTEDVKNTVLTISVGILY